MQLFFCQELCSELVTEPILISYVKIYWTDFYETGYKKTLNSRESHGLIFITIFRQHRDLSE